jgi:hypothetical protein
MTDIAAPEMIEPESPAVAPRALGRPQRLLIAVGAIGLLLVVSLGGFALLWDGGDVGGLTLVIPDGAAATLDYPTIDSAIAVPTELVFDRGEVLTIRNEDTAANRAGPWVLGAGETLRMKFDTPGEYSYLCTVDASESVTVTVLEASD